MIAGFIAGFIAAILGFFGAYFLALYKERDVEPFTSEELAN